MPRIAPVVVALLAAGPLSLVARAVNPAEPRAAAVSSIAALALPAGAAAIQVDGVLSEEVWAKARGHQSIRRARSERRRGADAPDRGACRVRPRGALRRRARNRARAGKGPGHAHAPRRGSPSDWIRGHRSIRTTIGGRRTSSRVNAAGVKQDRYWFNDTNNDRRLGRRLGRRRRAERRQGWRAEFGIPFSQLRFNPAASGTFGFAVVRTVAHAERDRRRGRCSRGARAATCRRSAS